MNWNKKYAGIELKWIAIGLVILLALLMNQGQQKQYCRQEWDLIKIDETTGALPGGTCYCPTDEITPMGYPTAGWAERDDGLWNCMYII